MKVWQRHNTLRFVFIEKAKTGNKRSSNKDYKEKKEKKVKRGKTIPSCKSYYAFYDFNESPMSTNKRCSKTEMQTERRGRTKKGEH